MATVSFQSKEQMLAAIYDSADLLVSVLQQTNEISDLYDDHGLPDLRNTVAVLQEIMALIAEGEV